MRNKKILVLNFGGSYSSLVAKRIRELHVFCEIRYCDSTFEKFAAHKYSGVIFSGQPESTAEEDKILELISEIFDFGIPILGICYGAGLIAKILGGKVEHTKNSEVNGNANVVFDHMSVLTRSFHPGGMFWVCSTEQIITPPPGFTVTAHSENHPIVCMENPDKNIYAVQFRPEVTSVGKGNDILKSFVHCICKCGKEWNLENFAEDTAKDIKNIVGDSQVVCALSAGLHSSVAALLVHKAVGKQLLCILIDHGLFRKGESEQIEKIFKDRFGVNTIRVDAGERFLEKLKNIADPQEKRDIIDAEFVKVFEEEVEKLGKINFLCQGTVYSEMIENGRLGSETCSKAYDADAMPRKIKFKGTVIEPLKYLFDHEVKKLGRDLKMTGDLLYKQPLPGPGLAIRIMGEINADKLKALKDSDAIFREEVIKSNTITPPNQYFVVLADIKNNGKYMIALRAVKVTDDMVTKQTKIHLDVLEQISARIIHEVKDVSRVVYDITPKPPATVEWE